MFFYGGSTYGSQMGNGMWLPSVPATITSVTLVSASGNFPTGTTATLYGQL
jgi:hypothetical protein